MLADALGFSPVFVTAGLVEQRLGFGVLTGSLLVLAVVATHRNRATVGNELTTLISCVAVLQCLVAGAV